MEILTLLNIKKRLGNIMNYVKGVETQEKSAQLNSELTPVVKTNSDGAFEFLAPNLQYENATLVKHAGIVHLNLRGTCPYELGENIYAKIKDTDFMPRGIRYVVAGFASGAGETGIGILFIYPDGRVNIFAQKYGLNWIYADVDYML